MIGTCVARCQRDAFLPPSIGLGWSPARGGLFHLPGSGDGSRLSDEEVNVITLTEEWGYGKGETLTHEDLVRERYRGIRPAPGYPACPDHTEKCLIFALLGAEQSAGISLTETYAMYPAASVSGLYIAHPEAAYFAVGKLGRDQIEEYASRKQMPVRTVEQWLRPNLNYDPDAAAAK